VFRWIEHTGELALEIEAPTAEQVFADALAALAELLRNGEGASPQSRDVAVRAGDSAALFAAWLEELVFLAETEAFVPEAVESLELGDGELRARIRGRPGDPPHLVKAVTYHKLEFDPSDGGWRARAVLDV
jgi:SHS2 domain-containing protein